MTVYFYRRDRAPATAPCLPPGLDLRVWRPAEDGLPRRGPKHGQNLVWWAFSRLGVFARPRFAEVSIWRGGRLLHRLIVTPRWRRFPFMDADDLQIGDLWTHPEVRGQGLARLAILEARRQAAGAAGRIWYLVEANNTVSVRLIESCGFRRVGVGRRTRPFGVRALGRFEIETPLP